MVHIRSYALNTTILVQCNVCALSRTVVTPHVHTRDRVIGSVINIIVIIVFVSIVHVVTRSGDLGILASYKYHGTAVSKNNVSYLLVFLCA